MTMLMASLVIFGVPQATPEAVLNAEVAALNNRDLASIARLTVGGRPDADYSAFAKDAHWPKFVLNHVDASVSGPVAHAAYRLSMTEGTNTQAISGNVELKLVGADWRIVPPTDIRAAGRINDVLSQAAYMASNPNGMRQARASAIATQCLSNVKQIALGMLLSANDANDAFKFTPSNAIKALHPYIRNDDLWKCPVTHEVAYSFNGALSKVSMTSIAAPANTVMVYEGKNGKLDFRHDGRATVGFADGHVKLLRPAEASKLRWKP